MQCWIKWLARLGVVVSVLGQAALGQAAPAQSAATGVLADRTATALDALAGAQLLDVGPGLQRSAGTVRLDIVNCQGYPYSENSDATAAARLLVGDLRTGLETGLQCLAGQGAMGRLHPYHEQQAHRLLTILEDERPLTFHCVEDTLFATAVATSPRPLRRDDHLYEQLRQVAHPGMILDTFRLGGILSRRYDDETYRSFFHLEESEILEHRNGQPLRPAKLHRYRDRARLMFHEVVHWLGHEHSAIYPDVAHLYETCCFGGSDYISDPERNRVHQRAACEILRDDELWAADGQPYRQMRLWRQKGYGDLKTRMRADYDD